MLGPEDLRLRRRPDVRQAPAHESVVHHSIVASVRDRSERALENPPQYVADVPAIGAYSRSSDVPGGLGQTGSVTRTQSRMMLLVLGISSALGLAWTLFALLQGWWWLALLWLIPLATWFGIPPETRARMRSVYRPQDRSQGVPARETAGRPSGTATKVRPDRDAKLARPCRVHCSLTSATSGAAGSRFVSNLSAQCRGTGRHGPSRGSTCLAAHPT